MHAFLASGRPDILLAHGLIEGASEIVRLLRSVRLPHAVTQERLGILSMIGEHQPISVSELAKLARVRPPTMSRMTTVLVAQGLAKRLKSKTDGRGSLISLTTKGRRLLQQAVRVSTEKIAQAMNSLSDDEIAVLLRLAQKLKTLQLNDR